MVNRSALLGKAALAFTLLAASRTYAQPPARLEFDVASLKPNPSGSLGMGITTLPGGGLRARNIHLKRLIAVAYNVTDYQIFGNIKWLESERYDLDAKAAGPTELPEIRLMVRSLLEDRFKLKVHKEPREMSIYTLMPAKGEPGGPGLAPSPEGDCAAATTQQTPLQNGTICGVVNFNPREGWIRGHRARISQLEDRLSTMLGRTVVDGTGLKGLYDITLTWAPDPDVATGPASGPPAAGDSSAPSFFAAVQQQLGLKLTGGKGPVDVIVIDSAEKATAN
jgi:uncharacterized protein (TIGR03435 family)